MWQNVTKFLNIYRHEINYKGVLLLRNQCVNRVESSNTTSRWQRASEDDSERLRLRKSNGTATGHPGTAVSLRGINTLLCCVGIEFAATFQNLEFMKRSRLRQPKIRDRHYFLDKLCPVSEIDRCSYLSQIS